MIKKPKNIWGAGAKEHGFLMSTSAFVDDLAHVWNPDTCMFTVLNK